MADNNTDNNTGQGRGWHGDPEGHAKAGKAGGEKVARERGSEFYENIGSDGGKNSPTNLKNDPERAAELGRRGGQASGSNSDSDN